MEQFKNIQQKVKVEDFAEPGAFNKWMTGAVFFAIVFCIGGLCLVFYVDGCQQDTAGEEEQTQTNTVTEAESEADLYRPVRPAPESFPPSSNMPRGKESLHSGSIDRKTFDPERNLIRFEDDRVWFESDHDKGDTEDDHMINRAVEIPLRRLVNLVEKRGAKLKVQEAYRAASDDKRRIHLENSLHREGRAVDLTSEGLSLSDLAKLCWQAGFDFVLYEVPSRGGRHLHCSVKRLPKTNKNNGHDDT
ncbi:MAG: D-Ala-D-Ala carboxypeptidase family metallohydrolase [Kiritimatiellia bacterium]